MLDLRRVAVVGERSLFYWDIALYLRVFQKSILLVVFSIRVPSLDSNKYTWKGTTTIPVVRLRALNISLSKVLINFPFNNMCMYIVTYMHLRISSSEGRNPGCASLSALSRKYGAESPNSTSLAARACTACSRIRFVKNVKNSDEVHTPWTCQMSWPHMKGFVSTKRRRLLQLLSVNSFISHWDLIETV